MQRPLEFLVLIVFAIQAHAQATRPRLSAQAQRFEVALRNNPNDTAARGALLEYYFLAKVNPAVAIPARRRHILWLIEHRPADKLAGGPSATIDAAGQPLADPRGFKLASDAWRAQISKRDISAGALVNAAYFFKLSDKGITISLLERALTLEPTSKEIGVRLGDEYALAILGVTMINKNGYPLGMDPRLAESVIARQAREALTTSRNAYVLAKAGYMLSWQGTILFNSKKLAFDPMPLAGSAMQRAMSLAPEDREVEGYVEQYRAMLPAIQRPPARRADTAYPLPGRSSGSLTRLSPTPGSLVPPAQMTGEDLRKVTVGMNREQLLKLGAPSGRITLPEDGHTIEIYQYSSNGTSLGTVRLSDGRVSSVLVSDAAR